MLGKKRKEEKKEDTKTKHNKKQESDDDLSLQENGHKDRKQSHNKEKKVSSRKNSEARCEIESFGVSKALSTKLKEKGINKLFEIQQKAFFPLLQGENVIAASLTGSGKTLAFILPIVEKNLQKGRLGQKDPLCLVLAPTRELAIQIAKEFTSLSGKTQNDELYFRTCIIYGGDSIDEQRAKLRKGCDVVVGTPGRVIDMIQRGELKLNNIRHAVLDEADKMLEMGFQESIEDIFNHIYKERKKIQVCLFSATIHKWVIETSKKIMRHQPHTFINLVKNLEGRCAVGVEHLAVNCLKSEKITTIADLSKFIITFKSSVTEE